MSGLIGGSGSTGSSLLRQLLNRHQHIFCGPETSLFCKTELFENWDKCKAQLLRRGRKGLRSNSWHIYRGTDLLKEEFGFKESMINGLIEQSDSFQSFANKLFSVALDRNEKSLWLEKTPGNAYNFNRFLKAFPKGKLIHIYRNPYDAIASMLKRGFSHFQATAIYLLNTSFALSANENGAYHQLSYEDLVTEPKATLEDLCQFLGLSFDANTLEGQSQVYADDPNQIGEWSHNEVSEIGTSSIGKFESLEAKDQQIIIHACKCISINPYLIKKENLTFHSIHSLCKELDYDFIENKTESFYTELKSQKNKDLFLRARKMAYYNYLNYPLLLRKIV